ncbi:ABC transporter ATP-binding protein [Legionella geestiana]|uniref:ABC transporter ATP-binding protein n=1 Tax=Legionella geestiana TaxID=45065 RepID=UPI0010918ACB|nr:ABC transporter ATP-binding protein [Legionella geestiana]QDQ40407.1 ABC transporter ATP-binding protein [Legionella geestiana]
MANALELQGLRKVYANGFEAVKGIDLTVRSGDFFALLGANGAGKSTTIGMITSLLTKTAGEVWVNGHSQDAHPTLARASLGLMPQEINLNIFENCEQILLNQAGYYGISRAQALPRAEELLQQLGLWDKRHSIVRKLSGGMKRRLMIARALIHRPALLILDEPTAGVDIEIRRSLWDFLVRVNQEGTTILLTTHYLEEAEQLCRNIAIIDEGMLVENTSMQALLKTLRHQTFVFDTEEPLSVLPDLSPFQAVLLDTHSFELRVENRYSLNTVFDVLEREGIKIQSMRNKTNRLEELFLDRIAQ